MKIKSVMANNRKRAFEIVVKGNSYLFPYPELEIQPSSDDPIASAEVDEELGGEGFTYELKSGQGGTVLLDQVLSYNADPTNTKKSIGQMIALIHVLGAEVEVKVR